MLQLLKRQGTSPAQSLHKLQTATYASAAAFAQQKYDYIIVGGGTAGCLLANKLSADPSKKVLVLEAGEDNTDRIVRVPAGLTRLFEHPMLDWNLDSKQPSRNNRNMYLARGKVLGGSSSTNATLYMRGTSQDYDRWGLKGWRGDDVLPWFKATEDNNNPALKNSRYHSTGGEWPVNNPIYQSKLFESHFASCAEVGLKPRDDFNDWGTTQEGYGAFQVSITDKGRRCDAYHQFLQPVMSRSNLTVLTRAQTAKIQIDDVAGVSTATGVRVQRVAGGRENAPVGAQEKVELAEGGEVLLTAGAVHTPQILMLSGVGDAKHLKEHGIKCHSDLPGVGANLQDHPAVAVSYRLKESMGHVASTDDVYNDSGSVKWSEMFNWLVFGKGPLTSTGCDRGAVVKTAAAGADDQPDLQLRFINAYALDPDGVSSYTAFGKLKAEGKLSRWPSGVSMQSIAARPKSTGSVKLASGSISDSPMIDVNYCSDDKGADMATLREGVKLCRKMAASQAWAPYLEPEGHPGVQCQTDDEIDAYIERTMHSANALVGTCAMGMDTKAGAVVSPDSLKVHGIAGLRVIDSSVMPVLPGAQTGAPTLMVAARAAEALVRGESVAQL